MIEVYQKLKFLAFIVGAVILFSTQANAVENKINHSYTDDLKRSLEFNEQIIKPATIELNKNNSNLVKIIAKEPIKYNLKGLFLSNQDNVFDLVTTFTDGTQNIITEAFDNQKGLFFTNRNEQPFVTPTEAFLKLPKLSYPITGYLTKGESLEVIRNQQQIIYLLANEDFAYSLEGLLLMPGANIIEIKHNLIDNTSQRIIDKYMVYGEFIPYQAPVEKKTANAQDLLLIPDLKSSPPVKEIVKPVVQSPPKTKKLDQEEQFKQDLQELSALKPKVKPPKKAEVKGPTEDDELTTKPTKIKSFLSAIAGGDKETTIQEKPLKDYDSSQKFTRPSLENEIVIELRIRNTVLDRAFMALESDDGSLFIPLDRLSKLLDMAIEIKGNQAKGWVFDKSNIFEIDLDNQTAENKYGTIQLAENSAFKEDGEIFVEIGTLSYLLPFDLEINWRKLIIEIISKDNFPFEERLIRRGKWKIAESRQEIAQEKVRPKQKTPYSIFIPPSVDLDNNLNWDKSKNKFVNNNQLNFAGDLLYGTLNSNLAFQDKNLMRMRLNYSRTDEDGGALPLLKTTQMEMGDIRIPGISTFSSGAEAIGFRATNRKLGTTSIFSNTTVEGDVPVGWDVELYRNGELVGFFDGSKGGRYVFENIGMLRNGNVFEIVKYGPHGEVEREMKNYLVPLDVVPPGGTEWELAGGLGNAALEGKKNRQTEETAAWYFNLEHGINNYLIASFESERNADSKTLRNALGSTIVFNKTTLKPRIFFDDGDLRGLAFNVIRKIGKTSSWTFDGDQRFKNKEGTVDSNYNWNLRSRLNIPLVKNSGYFEIRAKENLNNIIETQTETGFRTRVRTFNLAQKIIYEDKINKWSSNSSLRSTNGVFFSPNFDFNLVKSEDKNLETTIKTSFRRNITPDTKATLAINAPLEMMKQASISSGITTKLGAADLGLSGSINNQGAASVNLSLRVGLGYDHESKKYRLLKHGVSSNGWAKVKMHLDHNSKGDFKQLEGVKLKGQKETTSKDGKIFVSGLTPGRSVSLSIDRGSLEDPYLTPLEENYWVRPRAGVMETVDMIVAVTGEVEGRLLMFDLEEEQEKELAGVEVLLMEEGESGRVVAKVRSEFDGYYLFEGVKPGKYLVKPSDEHVKLIQAKDIDPIEVTVKPGGDIVEGVDIKLPRNGLILNSNGNGKSKHDSGEQSHEPLKIIPQPSNSENISEDYQDNDSIFEEEELENF